MSDLSGASSTTSNGRTRGRVVGVPKRCWCGDQIVALISKSDHNPYRRYYRCGYVVSQKLMNDNHTFKWVDEALLNEIEALQLKNTRLEEELKQVTTERKEIEKIIEKLQLKFEKEIFERVEDVLVESSSKMKKMMIALFIGCMIVVGCSKIGG